MTVHKRNILYETSTAISALNCSVDGAQWQQSDLLLTPASYVPDQWTMALARGMQILGLKGKCILDVGVGPGGLAITLLSAEPEILGLYGSDIDPAQPELAKKNVARILGKHSQKFHAVSGSHHLVSWWQTLFPEESLDLVCACLPQLKLPARECSRPDRWSHYYDPAKYQTPYHLFQLDLVATLLKECSETLWPGCEVVLVLAGRPGLATLKEMFLGYGFEPELIHREVMHQDQTTDLSALVEDEQRLTKLGKNPLLFFSDQKCQHLISAEAAWGRLQSGLPVFHELYVIAGHFARHVRV